VYLAIVDDRSMRATIADGVRGTSMPAFAQRAGGMLTDEQIDALVSGIRSRWSRPGALAGANPPSYAATSAGDVHRGGAAYQTFCQSCHGTDGQGGARGSAITNDSFLALTSDQGLRTIVIAGRPELGAPDWRSYVPGRPMSDQEVTDVVSWLASYRVATPGQPYGAARSALDEPSLPSRETESTPRTQRTQRLCVLGVLCVQSPFDRGAPFRKPL
jgi:mono/diheme cytochrome c family protein